MPNERFLETKDFLTPFADLKELDFVNQHKGKGKYSKRWKSEIIGRVPIAAELRKNIYFTGNILEIGAGSCWFSAELSKIDQVNHIHCLDFSDRVLREVAPLVFRTLKAKEEKITRTLGDYHKLPYGGESFDFVVIDAALHHTDYLHLTLGEINRVLKRKGKVIAIREPIESTIWPLKKRLGLVDKPVKKYGMVENTYAKENWIKFFNDAGLNVRIKPIYYKGGWKEQLIRLTPLRLLNGILYSRYYFDADKP